MFDHVQVKVKNLKKSKAFYVATLKSLNIKLKMNGDEYLGFAQGAKISLWITGGKKKTKNIHMAFPAKNTKQVDAFFKAALKNGGKSNGAPGIREDYSLNYYAAFVFDPDGNNIEVVCHKK